MSTTRIKHLFGAMFLASLVLALIVAVQNLNTRGKVAEPRTASAPAATLAAPAPVSAPAPVAVSVPVATTPSPPQTQGGDRPGVSVLRGGDGHAVTVLRGPGAAAGVGRFVIYVSAADCGPCRAWERAYRDAFVSGLQKKGIGFRTVAVTTLRDVRRESDWPADLRWVREANPQMRGTPWFFVINGTVIEKIAVGTRQWQTDVAPIAG